MSTKKPGTDPSGFHENAASAMYIFHSRVDPHAAGTSSRSLRRLSHCILLHHSPIFLYQLPVLLFWMMNMNAKAENQTISGICGMRLQQTPFQRCRAQRMLTRGCATMALILALIMSEALPSSALVELERSIPTSLNAIQSTTALKSKLSDPSNLPQLALLGTSSIALAGVFASIVPRDFDSYLREGLGTRKLNHLLHLIRASTAARSDCAHGSSPAAWASRCSRTSSPASYALDLNTDFSPDDHFSSARSLHNRPSIHGPLRSVRHAGSKV